MQGHQEETVDLHYLLYLLSLALKMHDMDFKDSNLHPMLRREAVVCDTKQCLLCRHNHKGNKAYGILTMPAQSVP